MIDDILRAQGYRRTSASNSDPYWQIEADRRATLTRRMGDEADKYGKFFGTLNVLADLALNDQSDVFDPRRVSGSSPAATTPRCSTMPARTN